MDNFRTDEAGVPYLEDEVDAVVQSIGRRIKTFATGTPWGDSILAAGPYLDFPYEDKEYFGIKCAAEIDMPYMYAVDIPDFRVPDLDEAETAVFLAMAAMRVGMIPYFGCMGGLGRTGTMLGILAKVMLRTTPARVLGIPMPWKKGGDPVDWVRTYYDPHAIETAEQERFVRDFDVTWLVKRAQSLA